VICVGFLFDKRLEYGQWRECGVVCCLDVDESKSSASGIAYWKTHGIL
jgi:hypothetical protein